jgi:hypothetical protein
MALRPRSGAYRSSSGHKWPDDESVLHDEWEARSFVIICANCGSKVARSRVIWNEDGAKREECMQCSPSSFDKFTAPSDKKIWMGYEAHPNEYVKAPDGGYDRKPEYRAEQEAKISQQTEEEQEAQRRAEDEKRKTRRTDPMDAVELAQAMGKAEEIAHWLTAAAAQGRSVN